MSCPRLNGRQVLDLFNNPMTRTALEAVFLYLKGKSMKTSAAGRKLIEQREGVELTAYKDSAGILTIGVGHTSAAGAPKVTAGLKITAAQASEILSRDLTTFEAAVSSAVKVPLNQNEFDALVSFTFNVGAGAFKGSTLLKRLNAGDRQAAADQFLVWNKITVNGKKQTLDGLTKRRKSEREQFLKPAASGSNTDPAPVEQAESAPVSLIAKIIAALAAIFKGNSSEQV